MPPPPRFSPSLCAVLAPCIVAASCAAGFAAPLNVYSIGNSLTGDLWANNGFEALAQNESRPIRHGFHMKCGSSLTSIVNNPDTTCIDPPRFGTMTQVFSSTATTVIDVVTLQPFYGATIQEEVDAAASIIQMVRSSPAGANSRIMVYATWGTQASGPYTTVWNGAAPTLQSFFSPTEAAYRLFLGELAAIEPEIELIPAGHVFNAIATSLADAPGTFTGISSTGDLYRDDIHASNLGQYVTGITAYATIYDKSPAGLGDFWMYNLQSQGYGVGVHEDDRLALQDLSWSVVAAVPEPDGLWMTMPATLLFVVGYRKARRRSRQAEAAPTAARRSACGSGTTTNCVT